jgi:hypothetical protein
MFSLRKRVLCLAYAAVDMLHIQFTTEANETLGDCTASFNY